MSKKIFFTQFSFAVMYENFKGLVSGFVLITVLTIL